MTRPTLKRMAVAAILATTTTTASIYDDRNTEPQELVSSDIHNQNDKSQEIDDEQNLQTAADNRKRKHRQPLSIRRIDGEITTLSNSVQESASLLQPQNTQIKTTLIGQSYKIPPPSSSHQSKAIVVKGTISADERNLGKIGNRAGLLAKRRKNNNNDSGNNNGNNNNKNRTIGNGKKAGSNQNRNQGGTQSSGNNNKNGNNKNGNRTNPNKKQRTQLPGQVRPGRQKKPGFRNRGGKLGGGRRGPRLFHDTSTHRWGSSDNNRWSGGTRWYSKSSKSKGGKKWGSSWSIDDCWDTSSWDLPSWRPKPGDWERSYSIDWHPPSWGDDDWKPGWDDDDWKPGWKPKPPSWSGGWEWVDDWNSNWGGGWWGKIEEESLFPTESPELFPTLSPTLAPTLSP